MMKIFKTLLLVVATIFVQISWLNAQSVSIAPTHAACPGQGSATISTTDITNPFFQLKNSAGTNIGSGNTTGNFLALDAGNYQVQVTGEGGYNQTFNFTIDDDYIPIPTPSIVLSGFCDNTFTLGGNVIVNMPSTPGKTFEYIVVKTNDPNFSDVGQTYIDVANPWSITEFGSYMVRIKDECGQTITIQRDIQPSLSAIGQVSATVLNNQNCGSGNVELSYIQFFTSDWKVVNHSSYYALGGIKVEIWEKSSVTSCPSVAPSSTPLYDGVLSSAGSGIVLPLASSGAYIFRVTTPCGESKVFCFSIADQITLGMHVVSSNAGCGASETMTISGSENFFLNFPVQVEIKNSSGAVVHTQTVNSSYSLDNWTKDGLSMGDYTVTYTDECGVSISKTVNSPASGGTPVNPFVEDILYTKWKCFDDLSGSLIETGTTQVTLTIGGYIPNRSGANVVIIDGPSNVGVPATLYNNGEYAWTNMLPGIYTIRVDSGCDGETPIELTFNVNPNTHQVLQQSIVSTGTSFCAGGGSISSNVVYNGNFNNLVELLDENGNVIDENTSGNFSNLSTGTYYTRLKINTCTAAVYYIDNPNSIVIADGSTGPQIIKKVGIVCEDATGTPTSTGSAYFEIAGASPITVEYKLQSATAWNVFSTSASTLFQIDNLIPNEIYDVRITSCGTSISTTVAIQTPGVLTATNNVHPCPNSPYTLSAPDYAGASYEWTNSAGVIVATTREYHIANYNSSFDGTYTAKISWGGCVVRYITLNLNSDKCGEPIDEVCTKPGDFSDAGQPTKVGITVQQKQDNWPANIPNGFIALESKEKGFVVTRVSHVGGTDGTPDFINDSVKDPKAGMITYDIQDKCVKLYNGQKWNCIQKSCNE